MAASMRSALATSAVVALTVLTACSAAAPETATQSTQVAASPSTSLPTSSTSVEPTPSATALVDPGFLVETRTRDDLRNYGAFSYMTATTEGLAPEAAARADLAIEELVDAAVAAAVADDARRCPAGEARCGTFEQTLRPVACRDTVLCLEQRVSATLVGAATGYEQVDVLVLDPATGQPVTLDAIVPASREDAFLADVNAAVVQARSEAGVDDPGTWDEVSLADIGAWAPMPAGIRVWFPTFVAGPGSMGVVSVAVAYPDGTAPGPDGSADNDAAATDAGDLFAWLCAQDPEALPALVSRRSDAAAVARLQSVLTALGYSPGTIDGAYDRDTRRAVREFQTDYDLTVDGQVGPQTWGALQFAYCVS
jgi:hypothetical protein